MLRYAGGTASYQGLEQVHWQTKEVTKEARHDREKANELVAQAQARLDKAVKIYISLDHPNLPNVRKQSAGSFMNQYKNEKGFKYGDVNASSARVRELGDEAIKTFQVAISEFEKAGEEGMRDDDYVGCFTLMGYVYTHRGELELAEEWFEKAIRKQKDILALHDPENKMEGRNKNLAACRAKLKQKQEAGVRSRSKQPRCASGKKQGRKEEARSSGKNQRQEVKSTKQVAKQRQKQRQETYAKNTKAAEQCTEEARSKAEAMARGRGGPTKRMWDGVATQCRPNHPSE